jgi:hypothetical protein
VSEIRAWLDGIGLAQYAGAFESNDIDMDLLGRVDDQTLKDIGVSSAGHRLRIRDAIATLTPLSPLGKNENALAAGTDKGPALAERRQVTVLFSDLVGSTALSARMDPEDLRDIISAYQKCVADTVGRFAGFVAKYMGDGVLVYFGYPQAHEDDAERAVRAGLELIQAVGTLKTGSPLQTRRWNTALSARRRIWRRAYKESPSQTPWSLRTVHENFWVVSSNCRISGEKT